MVTGVEILIPKLIFVVVAGMAAWGFVRDYLSQTIIPAIRTHISPSLADAFATLIAAIDNATAFAERKFVEAFAAARKLVSSLVLRAETVYRKLSANQVKATTTVYTRDKAGVKAHKIESDISWIDVPPKVKEVIISQGSDAVRTDLTEELMEVINKKVPKEMLL